MPINTSHQNRSVQPPPTRRRVSAISPVSLKHGSPGQKTDRASPPPDRAVTGVPREALLRMLRADGTCLGIQKDADWIGYGLGRPGALARQIGPVIANSSHAGEALLRALSGDGNLFIDVPEPNERARQFVESLGLRHVRTFWRMDLGPAPDETLRDYWASSGPEKG